MKKVNIIVTIITKDGETKETYKENVTFDKWGDLDAIYMNCMLECMNASPFNFTEADEYGHTLRQDNGNVWQFDFEELEG